MNQKKHFHKIFTYSIIILFIFILFILFLLPYLHHGFFPTMDDVQVVRINEMTKELKSGQFPVRYIDNLANGGGYMLFNFYSPLPYYVGSIFVLLGLSSVWATKVVFIIGILIGLLGTFFLIRRYTNMQTALMSLSLLLTSSYVGYDYFQRGALSEIWGFMFFPWIFYAVLKVKNKPNVFNIIAAGVLYALAIISHFAIIFVLSIFLLFIVTIPSYKKKVVIKLGYSIILGLLLSAFFWLPLILEKKYIIYESTKYATTQYLRGFLTPFELIGLGIDKSILPPPFPTLGLGLFLITIISSLYLFIRKKNPYKSLFIYFFVIFIFSVLFTLSFTRPLWDSVSILRNLQSPWRFLTISTISAIFISGLALSFIKKWWISLLIVVIVSMFNFIFHYQYMRPYTYNYISEYRAEGECATTTWQKEYLPKWVYKCLPKTNELKLPLISTNTKSQISDVSVKNNGRLIFFNTLGKKGIVTIAKYYYPSWKVTIDGKKVEIYSGTKYGLINFKVTSGYHRVQVRLGNTTSQLLGNLLTIFSLGLIVIIIFLKKKRLRFFVNH